jgi:hypothetical protein
MKLRLAASAATHLATLCLAVSAFAQTPATVTFQVVPTPNINFNNGLRASAASSPNDIWAVGQSAIHFDGTKWTAFPAPRIKGDNTSFLGGVVDFSPTNAWTAGTVGIGTGNPGQALEKWNGTKWSLVPGPKFTANQQPNLFTMTATSPKDIWAIGDLNDNNIGQLFFLFEHFDGKSWTANTIVSGDAFLLGSSARATNDVWAVGFAGPENDSSQTLAMHFDGTSWQQVATPSVGAGANQLNAVLALAANDVWAVGFSTAQPSPAEVASLTLIEHFDGTSWSIVPSPNVGPHSIFQTNRLLGLAANSATDIWAFGSYFAADGSGHQITLLLHWDGRKWSIAPSPNPTTGKFLADLLFTAVVPSPGNVWIFGSEDEPPNTGTLAIHATNAAEFTAVPAKAR